MAPQPLVQADLLQDLQVCNPSAKLSIFEDTFPQADMSPVAVLAKVATATKAWQKLKGPEHRPDAQQVTGMTSKIQGVCSSRADTSCAPVSNAPVSNAPVSNALVSKRSNTDQWQQVPSVRDTAAGSSALGAGNSSAAVQAGGALLSHAAEVQPTGSGSINSSALSRQSGHRVGFAKSEVDPAEAGTSDTATALPGEAEAVQGQQAEEQALAAELRARVAARVRR